MLPLIAAAIAAVITLTKFFMDIWKDLPDSAKREIIEILIKAMEWIFRKYHAYAAKKRGSKQ